MDSGKSERPPWKNGYYRMKFMPSMLFYVDGEDVTMENASGRTSNHGEDPSLKGKWIHGDFGEAQEDIAKASGKKNYNVDFSLWGGVLAGKGVLSDDGTKLTFWGIANAIDRFQWESEESIMAFKETGDSADAPPCNYKLQPDKLGNFLFISGAPGLGKSTTGFQLSKKAGYVYYEGDCFFGMVNPYICTEDEDEPSLAGFSKQKFLKGVPQERLDANAGAEADFQALVEGREYDPKNIEAMYALFCKDIEKERKRIGGDWAIAQAVPTRSFRDHIRKCLGPDLMFVVLHMTREDQEARIKARHGTENSSVNDMLLKCYDVYEPAGEDEPNTLDVLVTPEMTRDDVVNKILDMLKNK